MFYFLSPTVMRFRQIDEYEGIEMKLKLFTSFRPILATPKFGTLVNRSIKMLLGFHVSVR